MPTKTKTVAPRAKRAVATPALPSTTTYMLRTCESDMSSHGGFKWPESGKVECDDWSPRQVCGFGLHGLLHGKGDQRLLNWSKDAKWLVVAVDSADVVHIDEQKVKVPRADVVFCGNGADAVAKLLELDTEAEASVVPFGQASSSGYQGQASSSGYQGQASSSGYQGQASSSGQRGQASSSGDYGQASSSGYQGQASSSGQRGQASSSGDYGQASSSGDYGQASSSGQRGQASSSGDYGQASSSGDYGQASSSGYQGQASSSGDYGQASSSGDYGQASSRARARAGDTGILLLTYFDGTRDRVLVAYPGENGIEAGKWYKVVDGKVVESPANDWEFAPFTADTIAASCAKEAREMQLELGIKS